MASVVTVPTLGFSYDGEAMRFQWGVSYLPEGGWECTLTWAWVFSTGTAHLSLGKSSGSLSALGKIRHAACGVLCIVVGTHID